MKRRSFFVSIFIGHPPGSEASQDGQYALHVCVCRSKIEYIPSLKNEPAGRPAGRPTGQKLTACKMVDFVPFFGVVNLTTKIDSFLP